MISKRLEIMQQGLTSKDSHRNTAHECVALRGLVSKLRQELLLCKVETDKVKDQLQCLIYLVRRAWSGDDTASRHVANIVGVAPPTIKKMEEINTLAAFPKSHAVNNWAVLYIGLLNRMYHEEELELRASQLMYLQDREGYLDEQLSSHKDVMHRQTNMALLRANTLQLLQAKEQEEMRQNQERREWLETQKNKLREKHKIKHPPHSHLYRKPSRDRVQQEKELEAADVLFVKPVGRKLSPNVYKQDQVADEVVDLEVCSGVTTSSVHQNNDTASRKQPNSTTRQDDEKTENKQSKHVRSRTTDGLSSRPRPKTAVSYKPSQPPVSTKPRPVSAHLTKARTVKPPPTFDTSKTKRQLDLIERDLKKTTRSLQDRLGISRQGMV